MNRIYRLVFNRALGVMQVASEITQNPTGGGKSAGRHLPGLKAHRLALALTATLASGSAFAACTTAGAVITCDGATDQNNLSSTANGVTLNIATGAVLSVPPVLGGTAVTLSGNGITVNNQGTIDPTINGGLSLAAAGMVLGNNTAGGNTINVNNQAGGSIKGLVNIGSILGYGGQALVTQNAAGGVTNITNDGTVDMSILGAGLFTTADAAAIVSYGGAQTNLTNSGSITGRIGLGGSTAGNHVINAGSITGSVHLGNSTTTGNTFTAVSGSSVNRGVLATGIAGVLGTVGVNLAAAGIVDGGTGASDRLLLQNSASGPGAGTGGTVTNLVWGNYTGFENLTVNSGTWNLQGAWTGTSATINDGTGTE